MSFDVAENDGFLQEADMLRIFLKNPAPIRADGVLDLPVEEMQWVLEQGRSPNATHLYLLMQQFASEGNKGPFSVNDLYSHPKIFNGASSEQVEEAMHHLIDLAVVAVAPPELRIV